MKIIEVGDGDDDSDTGTEEEEDSDDGEKGGKKEKVDNRNSGRDENQSEEEDKKLPQAEIVCNVTGEGEEEDYSLGAEEDNESAVVMSGDDLSLKEVLHRQIEISVCKYHAYPTSMVCQNVSYNRSGNKIKCGRNLCHWCVVEREKICKNSPHLQNISHLLCYHHFNFHMSQFTTNGDRITVSLDPEIPLTVLSRLGMPFFESARTMGENFDRINAVATGAKVGRSRIWNLDDDDVDLSWYNIESYLDAIIEHGAVPPAVKGVKYRPGKITNSFIINVLGLLLWKRMCGNGNLRWPKESDLLTGSCNFAGFKELMSQLKKSYSQKLDEIAEIMDLKSIPMFDPVKLSTFAHNLKRKHKNGIWATVDEFESMPKKGLFEGHHRIVCQIGYKFPMIKE